MTATASLLKKYGLPAALAALASLVYILAAPAAGAQQSTTITVGVPDPSTPVLAVYQNNTALSVVATDDNLNSASWQHAGPLSPEPDCESASVTYGPTGSEQRFLTLTEADNGYWYCFKVADTDDNVGYAKHQVLDVVVEEEEEAANDETEMTEEMAEEPVADEEPLALIASQVGTTVSVSANHELANEDFEALLVSSTAACNSETFETLSSSVVNSGRISGLSWRDNGNHYCFRAADDGHYAYAVVVIGGLARPAGAAETDDGEAETDQSEGEEAGEESADEGEEKDEDGGQEGSSGDGSGDEDEDNNLRTVGVIVIVIGILAIIGVILFSNKKQPEDGSEEDDF